MRFAKDIFNKILLGSALSFILISCVTNPPNEPAEFKVFEKVFISANIDGAEIFVDDVSTGKVTPDTISVEVGERLIKLVKESFNPAVRSINVTKGANLSLDFVLNAVQVNKIVLIEDFANVSCDPCVVSNRILHSIEKYTYDSQKLVVIKYPTNFPSSSDPFFFEAPQSATTRINFYNILFVPTIYVDGTLKPLPQDSTDIKSKISERLNETAKFELSVSDSIGNNTLFVKTIVSAIDLTGLDLNDFVLHSVVTETDIEFSSPPGSNGETKFYNVMRKMLPNYDGESINGLVSEQLIEFNYQTQISSSWSSTNINTVAFIQNKNTKEVLQAGSTF
jgi:hypothetical protein